MGIFEEGLNEIPWMNTWISISVPEGSQPEGNEIFGLIKKFPLIMISERPIL